MGSLWYDNKRLNKHFLIETTIVNTTSSKALNVLLMSSNIDNYITKKLKRFSYTFNFDNV